MRMYDMINNDKPLELPRGTGFALDTMTSWMGRQEYFRAELIADFRIAYMNVLEKDRSNKVAKKALAILDEHDAMMSDIFGKYTVKKVASKRRYCSIPAMVSHLIGTDFLELTHWFAETHNYNMMKENLNLRTYNAMEILHAIVLLDDVNVSYWTHVDRVDVDEFSDKDNIKLVTEMRDLLYMVKRWSEKGNLLQYVKDTPRTLITKANVDVLLGGTDRIFFMPGTMSMLGSYIGVAAMGLREIDTKVTIRMGEISRMKGEKATEAMRELIRELDIRLQKDDMITKVVNRPLSAKRAEIYRQLKALEKEAQRKIDK